MQIGIEDALAIGDRLGTFFTAVVVLAILLAFIVPILRRESKESGPSDSSMIPAADLIRFMTETQTMQREILRRLSKLEDER